MNSLLEKMAEIAKQAQGQKDAPQVNMDELFKLNCPVFKLNFPPETPQILLGHYLIHDLSEKLEKLKGLANLSNLNDNTILFFTNRHIIELSFICYGIAEELHDVVPIATVATYISKCLKQVNRYREYKDSCLANMNEGMASLMILLPFITYKDIDDLSKEAIEYFEKHPEKYHGANTESRNDAE